MRGLDVIGRLSFLNSKSVERSLIVMHQAQATPSMDVIVVTATIAGGVHAITAIHTYCPEVVGGCSLAIHHNGRDAVHVSVLETCCALQIQLGATFKHNSPSIHQLLSSPLRGIDGRVHVQVVQVVKGFCVVVEVHVSKDDSCYPCHQTTYEKEHEPCRLSSWIASIFSLQCGGCKNTEGADKHEANGANQGRYCRVIEVDIERQYPIEHAEQNPWNEQAQRHRNDVHSFSVSYASWLHVCICPICHVEF